jgi:ABC-type sugar transport system permease subunit
MLTGGGPADATRVLPIFLYENFFQFRNGGYASAAGVLFLLLSLGFALAAARRLQYSYYE